MHTIDAINPIEQRKHGKRYFGRGGVKIALLKLLAEEPMHGYQMIKELELRSGGMYTPSAGSIYPTLQALAERGFISTQEEEGGRKRYAITEQGRAALSLLPDKPKKRMDDSAEAEHFRFEKIRRKLSLSDQSFELLRLITWAEQAAAASNEQESLLQELLVSQQRQLKEFLAKGGFDTSSEESRDSQ